MTEGKSTWRQFRKPHEYPAHKGTIEADIVIVGGGLTGLLAAYLLKDRGFSIALVEAETLGFSASGATTAFLTELIDTDAQELIATYGKDIAKIILNSHRDAIRWYEEISERENISCEFARTSLFIYAHDARSAEDLQKEVASLNQLERLVRWHQDDALCIKNNGYFRIDGQAKFHPLKFLYGLAEHITQSGVQIYEHSRIEDMRAIKARWILAATHYPPNPQPISIYFKKAAYVTYVLEATLPQGIIPEGLYEDIDNPYHYLRVDRELEDDRLLLGGADHRKDVPIDAERAFSALKRYLGETLPGVPVQIKREWEGTIVESGDGLAFIGPVNDPKIFHATGYSGTGITYAAIAAQLFCDYVLGKKNDLQDIYAANRPFHPKAHAKGAARYIGELFGGLRETF